MKKRCGFVYAFLVVFLTTIPVTAAINRTNLQGEVDSIRKKAHITFTYSATKSISASLIEGDGTVWEVVSNKSGGTNSVTPDMVFSIASLSKTYISACILNLVANGQLDLDDTLNDALYDDSDVLDIDIYGSKINSGIKIRELLNHTSGIDDYLGTNYNNAVADDVNAKWSPYKKDVQDNSEFSECILDYVGSPGSVGSYNYSNTNYTLLAMIIEKISGEKLLPYLETNFLNPLNLNRTTMVGVDGRWGLLSVPGPRALGYKKIGYSWYLSSNFVGKDATALYSSSIGSGNMVATAEESARWVKSYYDYQVSLGYIDAVTNDYTIEYANDLVGTNSTSSGFDVDYGFGIKKLTLKNTDYVLWGHTGTIGMGFKTAAFYMPQLDVSIALLFNDHDASNLYALKRIVEYVIEHY